MDNNLAEKMYQASEESWRLAGTTWAKAFDAAQAASDLHMWSIEEAAWNTYRSAAEARSLASQMNDQLAGQAREKARREALERLAAGNGARSSTPYVSSSLAETGSPDEEARTPSSPSFRLESSE